MIYIFIIIIILIYNLIHNICIALIIYKYDVMNWIINL